MKAKSTVKFFLLQIVFAFCFLLIQVGAFSQTESPYSRYGLGTLRSPVFSANEGMGYLAAPYVSGVNINSANPASYASLSFTTVEIGFMADGSRLRNTDSSYSAGNGSVNHFALAFVPSSKRNSWALSLGLLPYSNVRYNFIQNFSDPSIGQYAESYIGSGSIYNAYVGAAYKVKGFSIGANLGYMFGKLEYQKVISFPQDSFASYSTQNITNVNVKSFSYNVGIQYQGLVYHNRDAPDPDGRSDIYAFFGAYGSSSLRMSAKVTSYWDRTVFNSSAGSQGVLDTLSAQIPVTGKITLPYKIGTGVMFGNERFWLLGADFKFQGWGSYSTILDNGSGLTNSWQLSVGGQITPKYNDRNYFLRMQYRAGMYFGKNELTFAGSQLTQGGATLGLGFPFKSFAHINITGDFGSLGNAANAQLIQESYYRLTVGFVLNDIWFIKRKFN